MKSNSLNKYQSYGRSVAKSFYLSLAVAAASCLAMPLSAVAAGTAQLSITPASASVAAGANISFSVAVNTNGTAVNAVQSVLTYPAARFSYVSITPGANFGTFPTPTVSSGSIQFSAGTTGSVTGTQTVATVTLKALTAGSAQLNLATVCPANNYALTCSAVYDSANSNNVLASVNGGTYNITAATSPAPTGTGTSNSGSTPTRPTTSSSGSTATKTNPVTTGKSGASTTKTNSAALATQANPSATNPTTDGTTAPTATNTTLLDTKKAKLLIHLVDKKGKPLKSTKVTIGNSTQTTDDDGFAQFSDVPVGTSSASFTIRGKSATRSIEVTEQADQQTPQEVTLAAATTAKPSAAIPIGVSLACILAVAGSVVFMRFRHHLDNNFTAATDRIVTGGSHAVAAQPAVHPVHTTGALQVEKPAVRQQAAPTSLTPTPEPAPAVTALPTTTVAAASPKQNVPLNASAIHAGSHQVASMEPGTIVHPSSNAQTAHTPLNSTQPNGQAL